MYVQDMGLWCSARGCKEYASLRSDYFCERHHRQIGRDLQSQLTNPATRGDMLLAALGLCAIADKLKPTSEEWRAMAVCL